MSDPKHPNPSDAPSQRDFDTLAEPRSMLDRRYNEIKSGKVKLIPGDEVRAYFDAKFGSRPT